LGRLPIVKELERTALEGDTSVGLKELIAVLLLLSLVEEWSECCCMRSFVAATGDDKIFE
jgi:hypothetical protein